MYEYYKFDLIPLRYPYSALEPYIDTETMRIHHTKHLGAYVDNLNNILARNPQYQKWPLEKLIKCCRTLPKEMQMPVRNNAGGVYNHNLFFNCMGPVECNASVLFRAIDHSYGSLDKFKCLFRECASGVFGSGYVWLALNERKQFVITKTSNQDCVLSQNLYPILLIDLWEHAYYLHYRNRRSEYIDNWFSVVNWPSVQANYVYYMDHIK